MHCDQQQQQDINNIIKCVKLKIIVADEQRLQIQQAAGATTSKNNISRNNSSCTKTARATAEGTTSVETTAAGTTAANKTTKSATASTWGRT
jgi:hypothetical protein